MKKIQVCLKYAKFIVTDIEPQSYNLICSAVNQKAIFKLPINIPPFDRHPLVRWIKPAYLKKSTGMFSYDKIIDGKPYSVQLGANFDKDGKYYLVRADLGYHADTISSSIEKEAEQEIDIDYFSTFVQNNTYEGIQVGGVTIPYAFSEGSINKQMVPIEWDAFKRMKVERWETSKTNLWTLVHVPENNQLFKIQLKHLTTPQKYVTYAINKSNFNFNPHLLDII
jgi:hypothetical protein